MKKLWFLTFIALILNANVLFGVTYDNGIFKDFTITQFNPAAGNSTVVNLIKTSPEIMFFETLSDLSLVDFLDHNASSVYTEEILSGGITGGAAQWLNITSNGLLHYAGNSPGTMILKSFDGTNNLFDPLFSNYQYLVFDVQNVGTTDVNILPRIGPNGSNSNSSMYYAFDMYFTPVNVCTLGAGETAMFLFELGTPGTVWDYASDPYTNFELLFQPADGSTDFDVYVDNIGLVVPEPGVFLLFAFGSLFFGKYIKRTK